MLPSSFDAIVSQDGFAGAFIPGQTAVEIASGVVALVAVLIVVFTRGRLAYTPNGGVSQLSASLAPGQAGA